MPPTTPITGVPISICFALDRLGRPEISSKQIAQSLKRWHYLCGLPPSRLNRDHSDYTGMEARMVRGDLERALCALTRRQAAALRKIIGVADAQFVAKTTQNPDSDPSQPWWARRYQH